jgi:hypothetical protein
VAGERVAQGNKLALNCKLPCEKARLIPFYCPSCSLLEQARSHEEWRVLCGSKLACEEARLLTLLLPSLQPSRARSLPRGMACALWEQACLRRGPPAHPFIAQPAAFASTLAPTRNGVCLVGASFACEEARLLTLLLPSQQPSRASSLPREDGVGFVGASLLAKRPACSSFYCPDSSLREQARSHEEWRVPCGSKLACEEAASCSQFKATYSPITGNRRHD